MRIKTISLIATLLLCSFGNDKDKKCNEWEGHQLYKGEKGGCYYVKIKNKKRTKVYVDKEKCNC
jgi:hypothetical protein